jgi:hypothetical protein
MTTYTDSGYDRYFQRKIVPDSLDGSVSDFDFESRFTGMSADKLRGGQFKSSDGNMIFNLEEGYIAVYSNSIERLRLGTLPDNLGSGIVMKDKDGNTVLRLADDKNFISSPDGSTTFDFDHNNISVSEGGVPVIVIGYQGN